MLNNTPVSYITLGITRRHSQIMWRKQFIPWLIIVLVAVSSCSQETAIVNRSIQETPTTTMISTLNADIPYTEKNEAVFPTNTLTPTVIQERPIQITVTLHATDINAFHFSEFIDPITNPTWSHNGQEVAFSTHMGIWLVDTISWQNAELICPLNGGITNSLIWSSDDSKIAFARTLNCKEGEGCAAKTSAEQCDLTTGQVSTFPGLDQGVHIVFDWKDDQLLLGQQRKLFLYDTKTNIQQELALPLFDPNYVFRTLSFIDPTHVLYMTASERPTIQIVDIQLLQSTEVVSSEHIDNSSKHPAKGLSASIAPNGRWIVWLDTTDLATEQGLHTELILYDRETGETTSLLDGEHFPGTASNVTALSSPSWSPESNQLVFLAGHQIWVLDVNVLEGELSN